MAGEIQVTVIGNLTADPELRFTPSGAAVSDFTVASTPRVKKGDEWDDGETTFLRCAIWRDAAEHVVESLVKGDRVIVYGRLRTETWTDRESGEKRSALKLDVDEVGPSLKFRITRHGERPQRSRSRSSADEFAPQGTSDEPPF